MSWLPVGISTIAANLSAISMMGTPAYDAAALTAYEYLEKRFDLDVCLISNVLFQCCEGYVATAIYAPSLVISFVTGLPIWKCIVFMGVFTSLYTTPWWDEGRNMEGSGPVLHGHVTRSTVWSNLSRPTQRGTCRKCV